MSIALYMDHHIPSAITDGLRRRGIDVETAERDGRERSSDPELLNRCLELRRLFFSFDVGLLAEAERRQRDHERFFGLAYAHEWNITIGQAIASLELICIIYDPADVENQVVFLPM